GDIMSNGNFDDDGRVGSFRGIILAQLGAQAPGLAPDNRVHFRIVVRASAEHIYSDSRLLQVGRLTPQGGGNHKVQKLSQSVAAANTRAAANCFDRAPDICRTYSLGKDVRFWYSLLRAFLSGCQIFGHIELDAALPSAAPFIWVA